MFKIVGKAHYSVTYEGKVYNKIRFTLSLLEVPDSFKDFEGEFCDTVCVKHDDLNNAVSLGDLVKVSYNRYGKPDCLIRVSQ